MDKITMAPKDAFRAKVELLTIAAESLGPEGANLAYYVMCDHLDAAAGDLQKAMDMAKRFRADRAN
jgi:hypothetical protein